MTPFPNASGATTIGKLAITKRCSWQKTFICQALCLLQNGQCVCCLLCCDISHCR